MGWGRNGEPAITDTILEDVRAEVNDIGRGSTGDGQHRADVSVVFSSDDGLKERRYQVWLADDDGLLVPAAVEKMTHQTEPSIPMSALAAVDAAAKAWEEAGRDVRRLLDFTAQMTDNVPYDGI